MSTYNKTAVGPVCINEKGEILLVKKENEKGFGFTGGKVCPDLNDDNLLATEALAIHFVNTATDIHTMEPIPVNSQRHGLILDYIEESKQIRLVHFLVRVPNDFLDRKIGKPRHKNLRFLTINQIEDAEKQKLLLPNVIKVINEMKKHKIITGGS